MSTTSPTMIYTIPIAVLQSVVRASALVCQDSPAIGLGGVFLSIGPEGACVMATDGVAGIRERFVFQDKSAPADAPELRVIVKVTDRKKLKMAVRRDACTPVNVYAEKHHLIVSGAVFTIEMTIYDAAVVFPDSGLAHALSYSPNLRSVSASFALDMSKLRKISEAIGTDTVRFVTTTMLDRIYVEPLDQPDRDVRAVIMLITTN